MQMTDHSFGKFIPFRAGLLAAVLLQAITTSAFAGDLERSLDQTVQKELQGLQALQRRILPVLAPCLSLGPWSLPARAS